MKIQNITSNNGNKIANQFIIRNENKIYFQSYDSLIAIYETDTKKIKLTDKWDYSRTTSKYLYIFLKEVTNLHNLNKKEVLKLIANKQIELI